MALSGSVSTSSYEGRYLQLSWSATQSVASNKSTVSWTLSAVGGSSSWYATGPITVVINGATVYSLSSQNRYNMYVGTVSSGTLDIAHNADGTKSFDVSIRAAIFSTSVNCTGSNTFTLNAIPIGTSVAQFYEGATETSISMRFETGTAVDYAWYSTNGGSTWIGIWSGSASSGEYTTASSYPLTPGTDYSVKTKVKAKGTQTESETTAMTVTTYLYPYPRTAPNFTIGDEVIIPIYNPLAREITVTVKAGSTTILSTTTTGASVTIPTSSASALYSSIPNATSGAYTVTVTYSEQTRTESGTYSVPSSSAPTITGGTYQDTDTTVTNITGNNQKIIPSKSKVKFTATGISAKNSATVSSVKVNIDGTDYNMSLSGSTATVSNVTINSSQATAVITVTDSRGLTASKEVALDIIEYTAPTLSATASRVSGYYSSTEITPTVNYTILGSNAVTIQLKARKTSESSYSVTQNISSSGTSTVSLDNQYPWYILLTVTDSFGGSSTFEITIGKGIPLFYFDIGKSSVSVDKFPEHSNSFEVEGDIYMTVDTADELLQALADIGWSDIALGGTGLIDVSTNETGSIPQTGVPTTNTNYYRTTFIPIEYDSYTVTTNTPSSTSSFRIHGYDSNQTWVKQIYNFTTTGSETAISFNIPETTPTIEYIRLSYIKTGTTGLFPGILEGSTKVETE